MTRGMTLALRAKRAGANHSLRTVWEARRAGIPISWAFALVEQESNFQNVFGHDGGSILHGQKVTRERVHRLLAFIHHGGVSNGVGLTQLTSPPLIREAERLGGAHRVVNQLRVGFAFFKTVTKGDYAHEAWRYNGARSYQQKIAARQRRWHEVLK